MNGKNNGSVAKLIGNRLFIALLAFAVVIILFSAIWNGRTSKTADTQTTAEKEDNVQVISDADKSVVNDVSPEVLETMLPVDETEEQTEKIVRYSMPLNGETQRGFSVDELIWDDTMQDWRTHSGIDIASKQGDEVDTAAAGTVTEAKKDEMYGYIVKIDHGDGVTTVYKNLEKTVVEEGDTVDEGQMIGTVGNSAAFELAQDAHIHFEVLNDGEYVNPAEFIK